MKVMGWKWPQKEILPWAPQKLWAALYFITFPGRIHSSSNIAKIPTLLYKTEFALHTE